MRTLAVIVSSILLAVPISGVAVAEIGGLQRALSQQRMMDQQKQEREFGIKLDADKADKAAIVRDLGVPATAGGHVKPSPRIR